MRVADRFPANGFFTGERTFVIRSVPKGALIRSARLTIVPVADAAGNIPAIERLEFPASVVDGTVTAFDPADRDRAIGVTRLRATGTPPWTELAFHDFRTAVRVEGDDLEDATLQVDVGGLFVDVDANGTVPADGSPFTLPADSANLPGLSVKRIKLTAEVGGANIVPDVQALSLRAVASNLTLSIANQPSVWAYPGEVGTSVETTELAEFFQIALDAAEIAAGFAVLPVTLTTDTTARLDVIAEIEFDEVRQGLPNNLPEVTLDYAHDAISEAGDDLLHVAVPSGMQLDPATTHVEVVGSFEGSEITFGKRVVRSPQASLPVPAGGAVAHPVAVLPDEGNGVLDIVADAVDLLLSTAERNVSLEIDLREDFDGKPGDASLLNARATASLDVSQHANPRWISAALRQPVTLPAADPATGKPRIWVVVQSIAGNARWHLNAADEPAELLTSDNGGLSWRPARVAEADGPLAADVRLRRASPTFRIPVSVEVGRGDEAQTLDLSEFQPMGRVEFALNSNTFSDTVNKVLATRRQNDCPRGEQLLNGDFADRDAIVDEYTPSDWTTASAAIRRAPTPTPNNPAPVPRLLVIGNVEGPPQSISQVRPAASECPYRLTFRGFQFDTGARVEVIWRGDGCAVSRVDVLTPPILATPEFVSTFATDVPSAFEPFVPAAHLQTSAPPDAQQVEVRVVSGDRHEVFVDEVSLKAASAALVNADFQASRSPVAQNRAEITGWTITPEFAEDEVGPEIRSTGGRIEITNNDTSGRFLTLSQRVPAKAGASVAAEFSARTDPLPLGTPATSITLVWIDNAGTEIGEPLRSTLTAGSPDPIRLRGEVPDIDTLTEAEFRIEIAPGAIVRLNSVSLDIQSPTRIPVSFISESPGSLTVREFRTGFIEAPITDLPIPEDGPCLPTPADAAPGDVCGHCPCPDPADKARAELRTARRQISAGGLVTATARLAAAGDRRKSNQPLRGPDVVAAPVDPPSFDDLPVIDVNEVGPTRSAALATIDITTVRQLAAADPRELEQQLGFNRHVSESIVENAIAMLEQPVAPFHTTRNGD